MSWIYVDGQGHQLNSRAGAAYLRAINAGMPHGGVDVFRRPLSEQWKRWRAYLKGGPKAAFPTPHAPHVRGDAFDTHTTGPHGVYAPSKAHTWATKGGEGSDVHVGEKIKLNEFGFVRTVNTGPKRERWHFCYNRARDRWVGKHPKYERLQKALKKAGMKVTVDSSYGPETHRALGQFQRLHGLPVTYVDDAKTWEILNKA